MTSDTDEAGETYIPYSQREEWRDVVPVKYETHPHELLTIAYTDEYREVSGYFLALLQNPEYTERALLLVHHLVSLNPGHYTAWSYRLDILSEMADTMGVSVYHDDLNRVKTLARHHPKCYQLWYYRQAVISNLNCGDGELEFIDEMLSLDAKNYHVWSYRQWLIAKFGYWGTELDATEKYIAEDVRNNSAWNHRFYCQSQAPPGSLESGTLAERALADFLFTKRRIKLASLNESAWYYLRGLAKLCPGLVDDIHTFCNEMEEEDPACIHLYTMRIYLARLRGEPESPKAYEKLIVLDPIRTAYYSSQLEAIKSGT